MRPPLFALLPLLSPPSPRKNRTPKRNVGARPPRLRRGHGKVPPLPLCPSSSPTHVSTGRPNRMRSPPLLRTFARTTAPPFASSPHSNEGTTRERTRWDPAPRLHWVCGRYVPTSSPFIPSALTLPLVSAPPPLCTRPLLFPPPVCHVHRGLLPIPCTPEEGVRCQTVFARALPFLQPYSALHAPPTHPICPRTPCPCPCVRRLPRAQSGGKRLCAN